MTGLYKHYKGKLYIVEGVGIHTESGEKSVVYRDEDGQLWCRPQDMFFGQVEDKDYKGARFTLLRGITTGRIGVKQFAEMANELK